MRANSVVVPIHGRTAQTAYIPGAFSDISAHFLRREILEDQYVKLAVCQALALRD
jgi:hypothetical protein